MPAIWGIDSEGVQREVSVDADGRINIDTDSPVGLVQAALTQALLRETIALRWGMIAAGTCKNLKQADLDSLMKASL